MSDLIFDGEAAYYEMGYGREYPHHDGLGYTFISYGAPELKRYAFVRYGTRDPLDLSLPFVTDKAAQ